MSVVRDWKELTLGDVLTLQRGFDLPQRKRIDGPFPVVSSAGVTGSHSEFKVPGPGVVIGRYGSLGAVHWIDGPFWPLNTSLWVKDFKDNNPKFISYLLKTVTLDGSTASAVPGVNRNHLHKLHVTCPPPPIQRRIASVLSSFDDLIGLNERRIGLLEGLARSLYREWFVRMRVPGAKDVEFVDSLLGSIPSDWRVRKASEVFEINPRIKSDQNSFEKITMADLHEQYSYAFPSATTARRAGASFERDDVLMARITPSLENGKTALVKCLEPGRVGVGSTEFIVLRGAEVGPAFTYCFARDERVREHAIKSMSGSSGRQRVAANAFDSLSCVEPTRELAKTFEQSVGPMLEQVFELQAQCRALAATRDLLLPRLVTGRLDVADLDLDSLLAAEPV